MASLSESPFVDVELNRVLRELLSAIAYALQMLDSDATFFQFGSCSSKNAESGTDVDLMILSDRLAAGRDFDRRLEELRAGLLRGDPTGSFDTGSGMLQATVARLAQQFSTGQVKVVPVFAFGPLPDINLTGTIPLHVNGPISAAQLRAFCRALPLHARAIIHNARVIAGTFDPWQYARDADCDEEELRQWLLSLQARFHLVGYQTPRKMLRKVLLNVAMYRNEYSISEADLLSTVRDYLPAGLSVSDLDRMSDDQVRAVFGETLERALEGECRQP
jgi:hypothetical protein